MSYGLPWHQSAFEPNPDRCAFADRERSVSFRESAQESAAWADLITQNAGTGSRIALDMPASVSWASALHGCLLSGRIAVPIDSRWDSQLRKRMLDGASLILTEEAVPPGSVGAASPVDHSPDAAAIVLCTSGSSGSRTEVVLSRINLASHVWAAKNAINGEASDCWLSSLPVSHTGGLGVVIRCSAWGATAMLRSKFDAIETVALLESAEHQVTLLSVVPTTLARLLDAGLGKATALRRVVVGGAPLTETLRSRATEAGLPIVETWGLTQTTGMVTVAREIGAEGAGRPLDGIEVMTDGDGELLVRGDQVSRSATASDGWLHTGDLGRIVDGEVIIDGRSSSVIISGGENVLPERVEMVIEELAGVASALVYGVADERWGESVTADVVVNSSATTVEYIEQHCRESLSPHEVPKQIRLVDSIAHGISGKRIRPSSNRRNES